MRTRLQEQNYKIFKSFATASANRVEIRIYALISVVPCPILPTRLARISSDTAVFSPQQHRYFCASRGLSQWGKNKRKERDSISFLSFLPCCERSLLLAGNIIAEGVTATRITHSPSDLVHVFSIVMITDNNIAWFSNGQMTWYRVKDRGPCWGWDLA